ncbi:hypothetical protein [Tenacibaculum jejuense]|uniref:Uncharacterized protein n=1 Tax=Tenacibaculum jejuense TaxID=584609 RepID=A0A238UAH2_9FLAO|nr:hypothetical protein [Tenacibaculum jejuense]SNR15474.1 protein of unknown function [Tenacibaculum jejuense]
MNSQILYPESVYAYRIGKDNKVTMVAKGHEDGYSNIEIIPSMATIYPPIYMIVGTTSTSVGYFPYVVQKTVPYSTDLDYVQFQTSNGTERILVYDVMEILDKTPNIKLLIEAAVNDNQTVGYAYNSFNINKAIDDAIAKLRKKFPNEISAELTSSGFITVDSPLSIAFYYVIMEQKL